MHTKLITTLAAAALLTVSGAAAALAQAADINAATNVDVNEDLNQALSTPNQITPPNVGWSAHYHPHGTRLP